MADSVKEKRLALNDYRAARHSLARIIRMRFRGEIESDTYRDLVYGLHCMLGFDKLQKETALELRLAELEKSKGGFTINISPEEAVGIEDYRERREQRIHELLEKNGYIPPRTEQALDTETGEQVERKSPTLGLFNGEPGIPATETEAQPRRLKL